MTKNKFNQSWLHDYTSDPYVKLAQREGYRAYAVYKLKKIDEQNKLIKLGQVIADLGATSRSWSQYMRNKLAASSYTKDSRIDGTIVAIGILPMEAVTDVTFIRGDFREDDVFRQLGEVVLEVTGGDKVGLILSDMVPSLSGVASADTTRMEYTAEPAVEFAAAHLEPEDMLLIKRFYGSGYSRIVETSKRCFKIVVLRKPKTSRGKSFEMSPLGCQLKHSG